MNLNQPLTLQSVAGRREKHSTQNKKNIQKRHFRDLGKNIKIDIYGLYKNTNRTLLNTKVMIINQKGTIEMQVTKHSSAKRSGL